MDGHLIEYKEKRDESMERNDEICINQPHCDKFRKSFLDRSNSTKAKELHRFPHKEVNLKISRTIKKERVGTIEEHKRESQHPESIAEGELNSKNAEDIAREHTELEESFRLLTKWKNQYKKL